MIPKVLVLAATYNGRAYLPEQLESISSQRNVTVVTVVRDDKSTDGSLEFLLNKCCEHSSIRLMPTPERSGSAAGNFLRLISEVDSGINDFICLSDQDDIWHPDKLARAINCLRSSGASGYSCAVAAFWPDGTEKILKQNRQTRSADFLFEGGGQGCTFVMTSEFFRRVQEFVKTHQALVSGFYYHDWLIYLLSRAWGYPWYFDDKALIRYRQHTANVIGSRGSISAVFRRLDKIRNGWYRQQVAIACELYKAAGGTEPVATRVANILLKNVEASRMKKSFLIFRHGRRRLSDRVILIFAVFAGWI